MKSSKLDGKVDAINSRQRLRAFCKFMRALSPLPYLGRVRDCYVGSMNKCAGMGNYAAIAGAPGVAMAVLVSFTSNSSSLRDQEYDYRDLVKAASQKQRATRKLSEHDSFPRSVSSPTDHSHLQKVGVGRIDEESPCYFSASFKKTADEHLLARSQSCSGVQNMNLHGRRNVNAV